MIPRDWDQDEWMSMFNDYGLPPWPGPRSGIMEAKRTGPTLESPSSELRPNGLGLECSPDRWLAHHKRLLGVAHNSLRIADWLEDMCFDKCRKLAGGFLDISRCRINSTKRKFVRGDIV